MSDPKIHPAMLAVQADVGTIEKSSFNEQQRFHFRSADDVVARIHELFVKHGVYVTTTLVDVKTEVRSSSKGTPQAYALVRAKYTFRAADGSEVQTEAAGEGLDVADKAMGKAQTYALKTALLNVTTAPVHRDDPDAGGADTQSQPAQRTQGQQKPAQAADEPKYLAGEKQRPQFAQLVRSIMPKATDEQIEWLSKTHVNHPLATLAKGVRATCCKHWPAMVAQPAGTNGATGAQQPAPSKPTQQQPTQGYPV